MAHFAKVLDGAVLQVIVAEQEFIDSFTDTSPGKWIQCSYNTHSGIHWDPETGEPSSDQSKALRYNFPNLGWLYDKEADAFYPPCPGEGYVLNTTTYMWDNTEETEAE